MDEGANLIIADLRELSISVRFRQTNSGDLAEVPKLVDHGHHEGRVAVDAHFGVGARLT